jgi:hypothetical protein
MTRPTSYAYLIRLEDRGCFASNHYGDCGLNWSNQWGWIADSVAKEFECSADDVNCLETDDGDVLTVNGKPVAFVQNEKPARVAMLQAAE